MVICLEQGTDLHTAQLMPLTGSCFSKIQIGFTSLVLAHPVSPGQRDVKRVWVMWLCLLQGRTTVCRVEGGASVCVASVSATRCHSLLMTRQSATAASTVSATTTAVTATRTCSVEVRRHFTGSTCLLLFCIFHFICEWPLVVWKPGSVRIATAVREMWGNWPQLGNVMEVLGK